MTKTHTPEEEPSMMNEIPHEVFEALRCVLQHYYRDEKDHFENCGDGDGDGNHILHSLNQLSEWLRSRD